MGDALEEKLILVFDDFLLQGHYILLALLALLTQLTLLALLELLAL